MHNHKQLLFTAALLLALGVGAQQNQPQSGVTQTPPAAASTTVFTPSGYPGGVKVNYVRTWEALGKFPDQNLLMAAGNADVRQTTQYLDGLGRPLQAVQKQASTTAKDIVSAVYYDQFGRASHQFLPYAQTSSLAGNHSSDGTFKMDPFNQQKSFYPDAQDINGQQMYRGEQFFYSQTVFEASPLNRVQETFAPGNSWVGTAGNVSEQDRKSSKHKYLINTEADNIRTWTITFNPLTYAGEDAGTNIPTSPAAYGNGTLYKNVTLDEHGKAVVEYQDKEGKVILKKVQLDPTVAADYTGDEGWLSTYYVYDDLGQLRFVIPPKAVEAIKGDWSLAGKSDVVQELCFRYEYDARGRLVAKKVPGAGWVYLVYDTRDRLVFTQDANMRGKNQWLATLYDVLNRPVLTGVMSYSGSPATLQNAVTSSTTTPPPPPPPPAGTLADRIFDQETSGHKLATNSITLIEGFVSKDGVEFVAEIYPKAVTDADLTTSIEGLAVFKNPLPSGAAFIALTKTFYDDYQWTSKGFDPAFNSLLRAGANPHAEAMPSKANQQVRNRITGTQVRVLEDPDNLAAGQWLTSINFYDQWGRVIQSSSDNYPAGSDVVTNLYDFSGKVLSSLQVHQNPEAPATTHLRVRTDYAYDHGGRLLEVSKVINGDESQKAVVAKNHYDELGQLIQKEVGRQRNAGGVTYSSAPLEKLDYTYNIRGWLKGINNGYARPELPGSSQQDGRYFGMDLSYDWGFEQSQLNGNISGIRWRSKGDGEQRAYGFGYDAANRLLYGDFNQRFNGSWAKQDPDNSNYKIDFTVKMGDGLSAEEAYDANGNIRRMQQWGLKGLTSVQIDDLRYSYSYDGNSNKLQNVVDLHSDAQTTLGDFRTSQLYLNALGGTKSLSGITNYTDYHYDANGNLVKDKNKDLETRSGGDGMVYNHLNLPWQVRVKKDATSDKGTITYIYDAAGNKRQKRVVENASAANNHQAKTTTTTYVGGYVYEKVNQEPAQLQFFAQEEGRVRPIRNASNHITGYAYDYLVKDHLGNVRLVLTDEQKKDMYPPVTFEDGNVSSEQTYYEHVDVSRVARPGSFYTQTDNGNKVQLLQKNTKSIGAGKLLKIMAKDRLHVKVDYYIPDYTTDNSNADGLNSILSNIVTLLSGSSAPAILKGSGVMIKNELSGSIPFNTFMQPQGSAVNSSLPKAYLNIIFFDEQFKFVSQNSQSIPVVTKGAGRILKVDADALETPRNGYVYVYVSNESNNLVYFDNLQITHERGPILEETHYYPFGLTMAGISSKAAGGVENRKKFNDGTELNTDLGLDWYETTWRGYDAQIGRFHQVDPLTEANPSLSPFNYVMNNPLLFNDPWGLDTVRVNGEGAHKINVAQGDVLAWTIDDKTSYYTYDPSNKDAVGGFVGAGMDGGTMEEVVVTSEKKNSNSGGFFHSLLGGRIRCP